MKSLRAERLEYSEYTVNTARRTAVLGSAAVVRVVLMAMWFAALAAPASADTAPCECAEFADDLAHTQHVFDSRGTGATLPLQQPAHTIFATRVNQTYELAACLVGCEEVPDADRNPARRLLAAAAYKSRDIGLSGKEIRKRLSLAVEECKRCLELEPNDPECLTWHASARGQLARDSWNPFNVGMPRSLMAEFRAARGSLPPGEDLRDGAATRGEASILLQAPTLLGGDPTAARLLMEGAHQTSRFGCSVSNRVLLAEARTRTGDFERGLAELRAAVGAGLPACADQRYENASAAEEAARCLARIDADPALVKTWPDACNN
jgi:hypothetical protein